MITTVSQTEFYREFLMKRGDYDPSDFGVFMSRPEFIDYVADRFTVTYGDSLSIDELLLHPSEAIQFCTDTRRKLSAFDLPDDIVLRALLTRRKNPAG